MEKQICSPPKADNMEENLSLYLIQLQTQVQELEKTRSAILEEEGTINMMIQAVQDFIASDPDVYTPPNDSTTPGELIPDPSQTFPETITLLKRTILDLQAHFQQITRTLTQPIPEILFSVPLDGTQDGRSPLMGIPKIPLFLVHGDIYILIRLIHHYTQFNYFKIFPHFTLASALEQIIPETNGLVLISSDLIRDDPSRTIRAIRGHTKCMPVIVIADSDPVIGDLSGLNGIVQEECPLSELLNTFLTGLRTQSYNRDEELIEYIEAL